MRLGAPIFNYNSADEWIEKVLESGYRAVYSPLGIDKDLVDFDDYLKLCKKHDILISELGVWNNPLIDDSDKRKEAIEKCKTSLYYADEINASCVVNISGSRGEVWDGPHSKNLTDETFDKIVEVVRDIIDDVDPKRTFYTLETMPWMYPNSIESYLKLVKAIDRKAFAVHFDPVNLIYSPQRYYNNDLLIKEFVKTLGPYIRSVHLKDVYMEPNFLVHLKEVAPGEGNLNYPVLFKELSALGPDIPVMLEHLNNEDEYNSARDFVRSVTY